MTAGYSIARLVPLIAGALFVALPVRAQDKPVTPPDSYRIVMENDRVRMIEIHVKPRSKVNVDSPPGRERFLYMLSDGALILAPPGKTPYEFALHAGETAVFPAVSPTVENDTDSAVRALMVEVKEGARASASAKPRGKFAKRGSPGRFAARSAIKSKSARSGVARASTRQAASRKPQPAARSAVSTKSASAPLNLRNANARPAKKVTGKSKGNSS